MNISAEEWNAKHRPGTKFRIGPRTIVIPARELVTRCEAFTLDDGTAMVRVNDGKEFVELKTIDSVISDDASDG